MGFDDFFGSLGDSGKRKDKRDEPQQQYPDLDDLPPGVEALFASIAGGLSPEDREQSLQGKSEIITMMTQMTGDLNEMLGPVRDAVLGYKATLVEQGFSEQAAEMMTVEYHSFLMRNVLGKLFTF